MATYLCREHGITQATFYHWRSKYGGMEVSDAQELNRVLDENRRLKQLVADLSLDVQVLSTRLPDYILPPNPPPADRSSPRRELLRPGCFPLPWQ